MEERLAQVCSRVTACNFYAVPPTEHPLKFFKNPQTGLFFKPDVYCRSLNIVAEYNGPHHYQDDTTMIRDAKRCVVLAKHNTRLITFNMYMPLLLPYVAFRLATEWGPDSFAAMCVQTSNCTEKSCEFSRLKRNLRYDFSERYVLTNTIETQIIRTMGLVRIFDDDVNANPPPHPPRRFALMSDEEDANKRMIKLRIKHPRLGPPNSPSSFHLLLWFSEYKRYEFSPINPLICPQIHVPMFLITKKSFCKYVKARIIDLYHDNISRIVR